MARCMSRSNWSTLPCRVRSHKTAAVPPTQRVRSHTLWGRLHAGQRAARLDQGRVPTTVGRDKPGPTKQQAVQPMQRGAVPHPVGPASCRPAGGREGWAMAAFPPPSAGINPAPQQPAVPPTQRVRSHTLWGRLHAGRRAGRLDQGCVPTTVGRDKPGPTTTGSSAGAAGCGPAPCGAGFMPASGREGSIMAAFPPPSAGINPAPQNSSSSADAAGCGPTPCGLCIKKGDRSRPSKCDLYRPISAGRAGPRYGRPAAGGS